MTEVSLPNYRGTLRPAPWSRLPINQILVGDVISRLRDLPDGCVHCVVTSPPYFGIRDYLVEGQIGLERTFTDYIEKMVSVFREVRRVMRDDAVLWLNLGDSFAGSGKGRSSDGTHGVSGSDTQSTNQGSVRGRLAKAADQPGMKPKDLMMIPHRIAISLQEDGWWVRMDNVWAKPNPMVESVTDRPTRSHEYVFLLTKSEKYFYDRFAICEPLSGAKNKGLHDLSSETSLLPFRDSEIGEVGEGVCMPQMPNGIRSEVEVNGGGKDINGTGDAEVQLKQARKFYEKEVPPIACGEIVSSEVEEKRKGSEVSSVVCPSISEKRKTEDSSSSLQQKLSGAGDIKEIPNKPKGNGEFAPRDPQAPDAPEVFPMHAYGKAMAVDQASPEIPLPVVPSQKGVNEGSFNSPVKRGPSHGEEHSGGLPKLQLDARKSHSKASAQMLRNKRSVWVIPTESFPGSHFATFPQKLVEPCVLAGTSEMGACSKCGAPWTRSVELKYKKIRNGTYSGPKTAGRAHAKFGGARYSKRLNRIVSTVGWKPSCKCGADVVPCIVLDPFIGSGTTGLVAVKARRNFIGIELSADYAEMAMKRIGPELAQERLL